MCAGALYLQEWRPLHNRFCSSVQDWDKPEYIPDPDAEKPEDWDEDMDGEWEPPMIPNPEYKGQWNCTTSILLHMFCWRVTFVC